MPISKKSDDATISIVDVNRGEVTFHIVGTRPLIYNSANAKMMRDLLIPKRRATRADRAGTMKHDPIAEYRRSVTKRADDNGPTRLIFPATAFKDGLKKSARDLPGVFMSEIGRLTWVDGYAVDIYGIPELYMTIVRMQDAAHTPDVRSRAILPEWAAKVTIQFVMPKLDATAVAKLMVMSSMTQGIGDYRQGKGSGNFGSWRIVDADDADYGRIVASGGRQAQDDALLAPRCYDGDTEELFDWYNSEVALMKSVVPHPKQQLAAAE